MTTIPTHSHRTHQSMNKDHRKAARMVNLSYVNDRKEGIRRHKKGEAYAYSYLGKTIRNKEELARIEKLAIPPSWKEVWICRSAGGHIQSTGIDLSCRKQYRYHSNWNMLRNETKFHRMLEFGKALPLLRKRIRKDISSNELSAEKVMATTIRLMEETSIRIGNNGYEKLYGSYGLTTLKDKHVDIKSGQVKFCFTGKKGIEQNLTLKNKKLAKIIKQCRDIPGKELFQYYTNDGNRKAIDSGMVNSYIKEAAGGDFSAKDFRTWTAAVQALHSFQSVGEASAVKEVKKKIITVLDEVSARLGNTRTVCRKYYVHPMLLRLYEENKLISLLVSEGGNNSSTEKSGRGLSKNESALMKLFKQYK